MSHSQSSEDGHVIDLSKYLTEARVDAEQQSCICRRRSCVGDC